jgi:integrase
MSNQQLSRPLSTNATSIYLSSDQFRRILLLVQEEPRLLDLYDVIRVILNTGIRPWELSKLRWSDVDFSRSRIAVPSKTMHERYLPFGPKTLQVLEARRARKPASEFVLGESPVGVLRRVSQQLRVVGNQAGFESLPLAVFRRMFFERHMSAGASIASLLLVGGYRRPFLTIKSFLTHDQLYEQAVRDQARVEEQE